MLKLWNNISTWKHFDKVKHFGACFIVTFSVSFYNEWLAVWLSAGLGIGKEVGDYFNPNSGFSVGDLIADGLGIGFALLTKFIFL